MKTQLKIIIIVSIILSLQSCSTYSRKECESFDWNERGYLNALDGKTESFGITHYHDTCSKKYKTNVNIKEFQIGHQNGLKTFCAPENALAFGQKGGSYMGTCSQETEPNFLTKYTLGFNQYLKEKVEKLQAENSSLRGDISRLESEKSSLQSTISRLEAEVKSLRK